MLNVLVLRQRLAAKLVLAAVVSVISICMLAPSVAVGSVSPLTLPHKIEKLAVHAYTWGPAARVRLPLRELQQSGDRTPQHARRRKGGGGLEQQATNAGDASVLYLNAMIDLSGGKAVEERRSSCSPCRLRGATTTWPTCSMTSSTRWEVSARGRRPRRTRRPTCLWARPRDTPISASRGSTVHLPGDAV